MEIVEAAREELIATLSDLVERYDYEIVRDVLWTLKPDISGSLWCGDCRRYVLEVAHGCRASACLKCGHFPCMCAATPQVREEGD